MEPGTGTQYATIKDEQGEVFYANGERWKVGHDYIDTDIGDVCTLDAVIAKSSWCHVGEPEDGTKLLVFVYERFDGPLKLDPFDPSGEISERFIERYERRQPRGAEPRW